MTYPQKVAFITGASSGIGKACAYEFYRHGYSVVLFARRKERLEAIAHDLKKSGSGGEILVLPGSVTDRVRVFEAVREAERKLGRIDVLINNAGAGLNAMFETMDPVDFQKVYDLNVMGTIHCSQAVIPIMKPQKSGTIVNVTSVIGKRGVPSRNAYCSAKFAVEGLSESIRSELVPYGIHVMVARPARTDTEFFDAEPQGQDWLESSGQKRVPAEIVAREIYQGVIKGKREITLSVGVRFMLFLNSFLPGLIDWIVLRIFSRMKKYSGTSR